LQAWIFAIYLTFSPNPWDGGDRFDVPLSYSLWAYQEAQLYGSEVEELRLLPEDIIGMLVVESGRAAPYDHMATGKDGERGLYQLSWSELKEYNEAYGTGHTLDDLYDPLVNTMVAAYTFYDDRHTHVTKRRCKRHVAKGVTTNPEDGSLMPVNGPQEHPWEAHHKCGPKQRERKGCYRLRVKVIKRIGLWRQWLPARIIGFAGHLLEVTRIRQPSRGEA